MKDSRNSINILHVVSDIDDRFGGPSKMVPYLAASLEELGIANHIVFVAKNKDYQDQNEVVDEFKLTVTGVPLTLSQNLYFASSMPKTLDQIISSGCDLVHIHSIWRLPAYQAWKAAQKAGIPHVISIHSNLYPDSLKKSHWKKKLMRSLFVNNMLNTASFVHATEKGEVEAIRNVGFPNVRIVNIPNGIELKQISPEASRTEIMTSYGFVGKPERKRVLFLSRVHPRKRPEDLIEAFAQLSEKHPEWDLWFAGPSEDNDYTQMLQALIDKLGLNKRVSLLGMLRGQKKSAAFHVSDVFALPSLFENFGIAIGEAMAAGLPIITTTTTPWNDLPNQGAGWVVPARDIKQLSLALDSAMSSTDKQLSQMGKNASIIAKEFEWSRIASTMLKHYIDAIEAHNFDSNHLSD